LEKQGHKVPEESRGPLALLGLRLIEESKELQDYQDHLAL
jgi:hypothetical protein